MKKTIVNRGLAVILTLTLMVSLLPGSVFKMTAQAAISNAYQRVSDNESIDYWKGYFSDGRHSDVWGSTVSTQKAGAVWTDKSVFVPTQSGSITIDGVSVPLKDTGDNFLISMSVIASNKTVKGYEYIPTSTMLVLDVSGSMGNGNGGNRTWDEMVQAANKAIDTLINLNNNNRVGVVLYSGNSSFGDSDIGDSTLLLPLDRYSTTAINNNGTVNNTADDYAEYLTASNSTVGINPAVKLADGGNVNTKNSKSVAGGTYIQGGIYRAMEELVADDAPKKVADGVQAGIAYTPIIVLMSDGAPTSANLDYDFKNSTDNHETDIGDGGSTDERMGFLTQLTAANTKARVDAAYEKDTLFYTLGLGLDSLSDTDEAIAEAVLNPIKNTGNMNTYWNTYLSLSNGGTMYLNRRNGNGYNPVVKNSYVTSSYKNYVTQYFKAVQNQSQNVTLEQALLNAFQKIVDAIVIQSVYYPTEIGGGNADLGGYVTFRDELGEYMDIKSVKGLLFEDEDGNQVLHTGARLAENFVAGGGNLGQSSNPKPLGEELVNSVKERLGIADTVTAQNLIRNAYQYKQLYYENEENFSNYIGWYGDINGNFVDFWHEGHTLAEQQAAMAKGAKFIYKSYGYLGEVNADLGIKASDMMYTSIRVRKTIAEGVTGTALGEIVVEGSIPASLVPTITYEVRLNGKTYESGVQSVTITDTSAAHPARLLYEVDLRDDINPINITEKVSSAHKNADGTYTFYTNDWQTVDYENHEYADTSVNAFTHFEPSKENERYYYLTDSVVCSDAFGTVYTGATKPTGDGYYHEQRVFSVTNGQVSSENKYVKTSADSLSHAVKSGNQWIIPAGTGKHEIVGYEVILKEDNKTQTNRFTAYPRIKADTENSNTHSHHYAVVTFGNNGRLVVTPATGIKIEKSLDVQSDTALAFEFKVSGAVANESYTLTPASADGSFGNSTTAHADSNGVITVEVTAGTAVYITGLSVGTYTVTESEHTSYRALTINGQEAVSNSTTVQVENQKTTTVSFVNTLKGFGNLYITKEIISAVSGQTVPEHALDDEFEITVNVGVALAGKDFTAAHSNNMALSTVTVNDGGYITGLKLKHGETIVILNLPENTTATVSEGLTAAHTDNYTVEYSSHNKAGDAMDSDGVVIITKDANATVIVENAYKPKATSVEVTIEGEKTMDASNSSAKTFEFTLEKYENGNWTAVVGTNATVVVPAGSNTSTPIDYSSFGNLKLDFTETGVHSYRIYEVKPTTPDYITYDPAIYTFVVTVTDNNGQLEAVVTGHAVTKTNNGYTVTADFTNSYSTASVVLDVNKEVTNTTIDNPSRAGYEFELYKVQAGARHLIDTEVTGENGATRFAWMVDGGDIGTHQYIIKEKAPVGYTEPASPDSYGWHYDTAERNITVTVSEENGAITVKIDNNPVNEAGEYTFTNVYKANKATLTLENIATKTLIGRNLSANEFTFNFANNDGTLLAIGKNGAATDGNPAAIKFYKANGGNITSEEFVLEYEKVGTYHYKISEVTGNLGGVDYTTRIFDLVVDVTDDGNGNLVATYYFEDNTYRTANFVNTYSIKAPTSIELSAIKILSGGRRMLSSEFHFNVYEMTDGNFNTKKYENAVATGSNIGAESDANGKAEAIFKFSEITYEKAGIYYYQICETNGDNSFGIGYDDVVYNVTVTVTDNFDGTLTAKADKATAELVFNNTYTPKPVIYSFVADKVLTGRTLVNGEFEFALYKATVQNVGGNNVWTIGAQVGENVKNAANGDITFPDVEFTEKGEYYYIVKEVKGNLGGITYDDTEFYVTFTVTDDYKGTLSVETIITDDEGNPSQIVFNNTYKVDEESVTISGTKKVSGKALADGQFTFELYAADDEFNAVGNALQTVRNAAGGSIVFSGLNITEVGTYKFVIVEENDNQANYVYDDAVWCVTIVATDNLDGTIRIEKTVTKKGNTENLAAFEFNNQYIPPKTPQTGDSTNISLWLTLFFTSALGLLGATIYNRRKRRQK